MPVSDWADMMRSVVRYKPVSGRDNYGKPTFGDPQYFMARVNYRAIRTSNRTSGQETIAAGEVWLLGAINPNVDDEITLPDGSKPVLINWDTFNDENSTGGAFSDQGTLYDDPLYAEVPEGGGSHHTKLYFGGAQIGVNK